MNRNILGAVVTLWAFISCALASDLNLADTVDSCGDGIPLPQEVYVDNCYEYPCKVQNGDTVTFELVFEPPNDSTTLKANTRLMLGSLEIPFTLDEEQANGCNGLVDSKCPVVAGEAVRYRLGMTVSSPITDISVDIKFYLEDDSGKQAVCYKYSQRISS